MKEKLGWQHLVVWIVWVALFGASSVNTYTCSKIKVRVRIIVQGSGVRLRAIQGEKRWDRNVARERGQGCSAYPLLGEFKAWPRLGFSAWLSPPATAHLPHAERQLQQVAVGRHAAGLQAVRTDVALHRSERCWGRGDQAVHLLVAHVAAIGAGRRVGRRHQRVMQHLQLRGACWGSASHGRQQTWLARLTSCRPGRVCAVQGVADICLLDCENHFEKGLRWRCPGDAPSWWRQGRLLNLHPLQRHDCGKPS